MMNAATMASPWIRISLELMALSATARLQLTTHCQIENEAAQARNCIDGIGNLFVMGEQLIGAHRVSASARIVFN